MNVFRLSASHRIRIGSGVLFLAGSLSLVTVVAASPASARTGSTSCSGSYVATVKANESGAVSEKWQNSVANLTEQATSCANARSIAGAFARKACGECKQVRTVGGYSVKPYPGSHVTIWKGNVLIRFRFDTLPSGITAD